MNAWFEGVSRLNPPLRNDQHALLAITVPTQAKVMLSVVRVAFIAAESAPEILTQPV